jgi:hypothetical protein
MDKLSRFRLRFEADHFVEASLTAGASEYRCSCLNVTDGLADLLKSVMALHCCDRVQTTTKWTYSGRTWWILDRDGSDVWINLLEFDEKPVELPSGHWIAVDVFRRFALSGRTTLGDFVAAIVHEFDRLQRVLGDKGFRDKWGYEFPHEQVEALRHRIAG